MNTPNPYQTPESNAEQLDDGTYRPSGADWLFLILLLPIACIVAFFVSCFGTGMLLAVVFDTIYPGTAIISASIVGVAAALFVGWFMGTRFVKMQRKRYHAKRDLKDELSEKEQGKSEFS